jgi:hypothetical protein
MGVMIVCFAAHWSRAHWQTRQTGSHRALGLLFTGKLPYPARYVAETPFKSKSTTDQTDVER